jgi:hypothetical protein
MNGVGLVVLASAAVVLLTVGGWLIGGAIAKYLQGPLVVRAWLIGLAVALFYGAVWAVGFLV